LKKPLLFGLVFSIVLLLHLVFVVFFQQLFLSYVTVIQHIWYFALIMVTTSVGIVLPVLKSSGEINSRFGQMVIIAAAIADIFSIILFTLTAFVIEKGFKLELLWILVLLVVFYIFYHIGKWLKNVSVFNKITFQLSHAASQIKIPWYYDANSGICCYGAIYRKGSDITWCFFLEDYYCQYSDADPV